MRNYISKSNDIFYGSYRYSRLQYEDIFEFNIKPLHLGPTAKIKSFAHKIKRLGMVFIKRGYLFGFWT